MFYNDLILRKITFDHFSSLLCSLAPAVHYTSHSSVCYRRYLLQLCNCSSPSANVRQMAKQYDILIRMLMIGDSGVGKTCMLCRFTDEGFITPHISTIGIDFKMKNLVLDDKRIRVQIWDTAGQERYYTITTQYFRRAQGFMLVYDITSEASFLNIQKWMAMVAEHAGPDADMFLVGNKSDAETLRTVPVEDAEKLAKANGMGFVETSAHNSSNINEAFVLLTRQIMRKRKKSIERQMENIRLYAREDSRADLEDARQGKTACCS